MVPRVTGLTRVYCTLRNKHNFFLLWVTSVSEEVQSANFDCFFVASTKLSIYISVLNLVSMLLRSIFTSFYISFGNNFADSVEYFSKIFLSLTHAVYEIRFLSNRFGSYSFNLNHKLSLYIRACMVIEYYFDDTIKCIFYKFLSEIKSIVHYSL